MKLIKWITVTVIVTLGLTATPLFGKETINSLYSEYQKMMSEKDYQKALQPIKKAYYLGVKKMGAANATTQALEQNYVQLYVALGRKLDDYDSKYIVKILDDRIDLIEDNEGDDSLSLIDPLMTKGTVKITDIDNMRQLRSGLKSLDRAIDIAEKHHESQPTLQADLSLEAVNLLLGSAVDYNKARQYAKTAYEGFKAASPNGSEELAKATFMLAKTHFLNNDHEESNAHFAELVELHKVANVLEHPRVLQAYAFMVQNYEELDQSDNATTYCRKIGQSKPWNDNQEQKPIYLPVPEYKFSQLMTGRLKKREENIYSRYRITIDENGFVSDFEAIEGTGNASFNSSIEKTLPKWRFAPKFVDGQAVVADTHYTFELKFK